MNTSQKQARYMKPSVKTKILKLNFFYTSTRRHTDSFNDLLGISVLASSHGCGGSSGSKSEETPI